MGRAKAVLFPQTAKKLKTTGEQIKLARLRRELSSQQVAERAHISRITLHKIESGDPSVSMGMYLAVLNALGLQDDILLLARDDRMGRIYQDMQLVTPKRIREKKQ